MTPSCIPVLLYHGVAEPAADRWAVTPARFGEHLAAVRASGRTALTMLELAEALHGRSALPERPVAITFDDGLADARPALERVVDEGLKATLYVQTGPVGTAGWLDADDLRHLATLAPAVELGAHTVDHPRLDELSGDRLRRQVTACRDALEAVLERPVAGFAYPHGAHDRRSRRAVVDAGYAYAAAVKNAVARPDEDPFAIARWTVTRDVTAQRIAEVLEGVGVPRSWRGERLVTRAYRAARRTRRVVGELRGARAAA